MIPTISLFVLYSQVALSVPRAKRLTRQAIAIVERDTGVRLVPRYRRRRDITQRPDIENSRVALGSLSHYFYRENIAPEELAILLTPPGIAPWGQEASTGQAVICGRRAYVGIISTHHMNVITMAHEIGHMMGAQHTEWTGSIMDPSPHVAAYQRGWQTHFDGSSIDLIRRCLGNH